MKKCTDFWPSLKDTDVGSFLSNFYTKRSGRMCLCHAYSSIPPLPWERWNPNCWTHVTIGLWRVKVTKLGVKKCQFSPTCIAAWLLRCGNLGQGRWTWWTPRCWPSSSRPETIQLCGFFLRPQSWWTGPMPCQRLWSSTSISGQARILFTLLGLQWGSLRWVFNLFFPETLTTCQFTKTGKNRRSSIVCKVRVWI